MPPPMKNRVEKRAVQPGSRSRGAGEANNAERPDHHQDHQNVEEPDDQRRLDRRFRVLARVKAGGEQLYENISGKSGHECESHMTRDDPILRRETDATKKGCDKSTGAENQKHAPGSTPAN